MPAENLPSRGTGSASLIGNARWLLRLRWVAIVGQLATVGFVVLVLGLPLRPQPLLLLIAATAVSNVAFQGWLYGRAAAPHTAGGPRASMVLVATMILDLLTLTGLLYFSGGQQNPFWVFYFVNLALAAVVLPSGWSWVLTGLAIAGFGSLALLSYTPIPELEAPPLAPPAARGLHRAGLLVAFAACAVVICYFITRIARELQQREAELRMIEKQRARSERLEALATLAAGAGHELASPLSTIAVIAKDLTRHLEGSNVPPSVVEDVALIRSELDHCRMILDRMSGSAGQAAGEQVGRWRVDRIVQEVVQGLRRSDRVTVRGLDTCGTCSLVAPLQGLAQALRGLVQNGLDASEPHQQVVIAVDATAAELILTVRDQGQGMSAEQLARAGEPFYTTKEPGQGMGLGLFLTRNVIERLGGSLRLASLAGQGTTAEVRLPMTREHGSP